MSGDLDATASENAARSQGPRRLVIGALRNRREFGDVLREGRRARRELVAVAAMQNSVGTPRVGYAVGRRVGGAVVRNRVRRRLRELLRDQLRRLGARDRASGTPVAAWDIVVTAQPSAAGATFEQLALDLASAWQSVTSSGRGRSDRAPRTPGARRGGGRPAGAPDQ